MIIQFIIHKEFHIQLSRSVALGVCRLFQVFVNHRNVIANASRAAGVHSTAKGSVHERHRLHWVGPAWWHVEWFWAPCYVWKGISVDPNGLILISMTHLMQSMIGQTDRHKLQPVQSLVTWGMWVLASNEIAW